MSCELIITPKLMKMSKVTKDVKRSNYLSTNQEISLIMIGFLLDPHLVKYFIDILASVELEDAREFHQSLREISVVNSAAIPICNRLWRTHVELFKYISYIRQGFIKQQHTRSSDYGDNYYLEVNSLSDKIKILNQFFEDELQRMKFSAPLMCWPNLKDVQYAFTIFRHLNEDYHDIVFPAEYRFLCSFLCSGLNGSITLVSD